MSSDKKNKLIIMSIMIILTIAFYSFNVNAKVNVKYIPSTNNLLSSSESLIIWEDKVIDLNLGSDITVDGNFLIDNCTITGGLIIKGSGIVNIVNTQWVCDEGILINLENSEDIELKIKDSTMISNGFALVSLNKDNCLIAENSVMKDISESGGGIFSSEDNITVILADCKIEGRLNIENGGGNSRINITNNKWEKGAGITALIPAGIVLENMSSVVVEGNMFDMNLETFIGVYDSQNIRIVRNKLFLNTTKYGYTTNIDEWEDGQIGMICYNPKNDVVIEDNIFSNHGIAIYLANELNVNTKVSLNTFNNSHINTVNSIGGNIEISDNIFHQSTGALKLRDSEIAKIENNVFNDSSVDVGNTDIYIYNSNETSISKNVFVSGKGIGESILVLAANNTRIQNNSFLASKSDRLIYFTRAIGIEIRDNIFVNEKILLREVEDGTIYLNRFYKRSDGYEYNVTNVKWDNGTFGNYWENFTIQDDDDDYVGNNTYQGNSTEYGGVEYEGANDSHPLSLKFFGIEDDTPPDSSSIPPDSSSIPLESTSNSLDSSSVQIVTTITDSHESNAINFSLIIIILFLVSRRRSKRVKRKDN